MSLRFLVCMTAALTPLSMPATSFAAAPQKKASIEGITEYRFDNGLKLLLFQDQSRPTVTVNLTLFVGSRHEGYGEAGMAHLLEHMLFKGTPTHPNIPQVLQERGASFNGTTWVDRTNYYETLPASEENLEFALRLEADRMMNSYIKGEDLASEMTVVRNEFESGENSPRTILRQRMSAAAFEWHNYGQTTIGNRSDIERVPLPKLRDFYRRYYQPDNAMVVIAGQFDEEQAIALTEKYFGSIPKPERELDMTYTEEPAQDGERAVSLRRVGDVGMVGVSYHIPAGPHPEFAAVDVLATILATEPAGRLYKALVETKKATSVVGSSFAWRDPGLMTMMAEVPDRKQLDSVLEEMLAEIEKIGTEGVTEAEVERVKQQILSQRERSINNTSRVAVELSEWAAQGDWRLFFLYRDRIEEVTASDVREVAARYLQVSNRTIGKFIPSDKPQRVAIPATPSVAKMVENYQGREAVVAGEKFDSSPENIESRTTRFELANGAKVAFLPKKTRGEAVNLQVTLRYGDAESLEGMNVACSLLPTLMTRGTSELNYQQLNDALDKNRAGLNGSGNLGTATFTVQTSRQHLETVLELLRQVLREPTLPSEELEVLRREQLARYEKSKTDPQALAASSFRRTLSPYPMDDVRYNPTVEESLERAKAVTLEQVQTLHREFLGASHAEIAVVGDFDPETTRPILAEMLGDWSGQKSYARVPQVAFPEVKGQTVSINTPDKANAVYFGGMTLPLQDTDPEYAGLILADFVFGGGSLSSRLGDRVRQQDGLSYGIGSFFQASSHDPYARLGIFAISNPANSQKVVAAIREELERLEAKGVTEKELEQAKKGYLQMQSVQRTNDSQLVSLLASTLNTGRTMAFQAKLEQQISELSKDQVDKAIRRHFTARRLVAIRAGDFEKVESQD